MPADSNPAEGTDVPHGEKFLGSPVDTTSYRYISDLTLYWDGKALRDTKRGEQASHEADYSAEMMYEIFSEATGTTISAEKTPAISKLIGYVLDKCSVTADRLKEIRFRKRPFVQLGEPSFVPGDEEKERGKSSFPSGHTNLGWTEALVMTELAPDHQNEILKCGYEYGYNRQIVGYHWFTDVIATRQLASALYAYLHSDAEFQKLMQEARKEYQSMTASAIRTVTPDDNDSRRAAIYTLDGRRVYGKPARKGIYISDGKKVVN
jgi:acid phosphatase (class A)